MTSKWSIGKITMESQITDGKINLKGNFVFREKPKRADYLLYLSANNPIAVIEAKDNHHSISHGLQQAMEYAKMLDLPFAFSSNGDGFAEHDFLTGTEREFGLDEFPTEAELIARYKKESGLTSAQEIAIDQPYYTSQNTYPPRYYQRIAINRTIDAIARGQLYCRKRAQAGARLIIHLKKAPPERFCWVNSSIAFSRSIVTHDYNRRRYARA